MQDDRSFTDEDNRPDAVRQDEEGNRSGRPSSPADSVSSIIANILSALVVLSGIAMFGSLILAVPPLERMEEPERGLELLVNQTLLLEDALKTAAPWEQGLYEVVSGGASELDQAVAWYRELAAFSGESRVQLYLTILEAESNRVDVVEQRVNSWKDGPEPFPTFARLIEGAYLTRAGDPDSAVELRATLDRVVPEGWFHDKVASRLAEQSDHDAFVGSDGESARRRAALLLDRARWFLTVEVGLFVVGGVALLAWIIPGERRKDWILVGEALIPPPWRGRTGAVVLLRGAAVGLLVIVALGVMAPSEASFALIALPLISLPLFSIAYTHLIKPSGSTVGEIFGLHPVPDAPSRLAYVVPMVLVLGVMGDLGIAMLGNARGVSIHWSEWFDPMLVWGSWWMVGASMLEAVVYAPLVEELAFRGILFGSLRRRLSFWPAAVVSALVFGAAHGYGWIGFLSVSWSGLVWAWSYERTGSLLPAIMGHALNNLLVTASVIAFLR